MQAVSENGKRSRKLPLDFRNTTVAELSDYIRSDGQLIEKLDESPICGGYFSEAISALALTMINASIYPSAHIERTPFDDQVHST